MSIIETTFDIHDLREFVAAGDVDAFGALLADDVEWRLIDQRTPPAAPAVRRGRDEVVAMVRGAVEHGIASHVTDGFVAGDRGAIQITCTYPSGEHVVENALVEIRAGRIVRWSGVQAWDE